jgi:hypothetical protein
MPHWVMEQTALISSPLHKLPMTTVSVYRGTHMISTPNPGDSLRNLGFLSVTTNPLYATKFGPCKPCYRVEFVNGAGSFINKITNGLNSEALIAPQMCWNVISVQHANSITLKTEFPWARNIGPNDIYVKMIKNVCQANSKNILETVASLESDEASELTEILDVLENQEGTF